MAWQCCSTWPWPTRPRCCTGPATSRRKRCERTASVTGDVDPGAAGGAGHCHVAVDSLSSSYQATSDILPAMYAASGTTEGHILALIAVGTRAVADVACCR
ncbi:Ms4533A family Cys-rich leader peptide [Mycolicibacterium llatzerense]|uniref:Ms4533A family Cys-rich leader peptide n=1 Tax=Mycolicibacterium llatzerense TaxID=280871 RepID=UPI0036F3FF2B